MRITQIETMEKGSLNNDGITINGDVYINCHSYNRAGMRGPRWTRIMNDPVILIA